MGWQFLADHQSCRPYAYQLAPRKRYSEINRPSLEDMTFEERAEELYLYNCNPEMIVRPEIGLDAALQPLTLASREMHSLGPSLLLWARTHTRLDLARELSVKVATMPTATPAPQP